MSVKCILTEQGGKGGNSISYGNFVLDTQPTKKSYYAGETFDLTGLTGTVDQYLDGIYFQKVEVKLPESAAWLHAKDPTSGTDVLSDGTTAVKVFFQPGPDADPAEIEITGITVTKSLTSIEVTTQPTAEQEYNKAFDNTGMVVTATYSDGSTAVIPTGYSVSPSTMPAPTAACTITIEYGDASTAALGVGNRSTTFDLQVYRQTIPTEPSWKSNLTYTGSAQSVTGTSYWNDFDSSKMTIGGETSKTDADTYTATFTPTANYRWSDKTFTAKNKTWTINKKDITVPTVTNLSFTYNGSSQGPTVTGVDASYVIQGGTASAVAANDYSVTFTLKDTANTQWAGGTDTAPKSTDWTIAKLGLDAPTAATTSFTYSGVEQGPTVSGYNATYMDKTGTEKATNASATAYTITYSLKDTNNTKWKDNVAGNKTINWTIAKKTLTITAGTIGTIGASNYSSGLDIALSGIDAYYNGTITPSVTASNGVISAELTGSGTSRAIKVKGNGSTAGVSTIKVVFGADSNYNTIADLTFNVTAAYFTWDGVTNTNTYAIPTAAQTTADWWSGLKSWLATSTETERARALGKKVQVTLTSAVLGTTTHYLRCVGYDRDGANTLTFQTMNCLATNTDFCSSQYSTFGNQALWTNGSTDSNARQKCNDYYNAFPGKTAIRSVQKRYLSTQSGTQGNTACDKTYTEKVFLPSMMEMGYAAASSQCSANNEYAVENTSTSDPKYQYYTGNNRRVKYAGTDNDPEGKTSGGQYYWARSRCYVSGSPDRVCGVRGNGSAGYDGYTGSYGLAPAFAIG